jgi:hypothetical protein
MWLRPLLAGVCDIFDLDEIKSRRPRSLALTLRSPTWRPIVVAGATRVRRSRRYASECRSAEPNCNVAAPRPPNANLRKLSGKQRRSQRNEDHCISQAIMLQAQSSGRGIGLEDLKGIHERIKSSPTRAVWQRVVRAVADIRRGPGPTCRHPSYPCKGCLRVERSTIRTNLNQAAFSCISCGLGGHADVIAAPQQPLPGESRFGYGVVPRSARSRARVDGGWARSPASSGSVPQPGRSGITR